MLLLIIIATIIETDHSDSSLTGSNREKLGDICGLVSIEHYLLSVEAGFGKR